MCRFFLFVGMMVRLETPSFYYWGHAVRLVVDGSVTDLPRKSAFETFGQRFTFRCLPFCFSKVVRARNLGQMPFQTLK